IQLLARFFIEAKRAQESRIDRSNAIELWLLLKHLLENLSRLHMLAAIEKHLGAERFNEGMIRFEHGALIEFRHRFIVTALIKKDARAVVAGDDALSGIQSRHTLKAPQRLVVIAVEPSHNATGEMNTWIVGRFASKLLGHFARALLFTAGQVNQDRMPPRFQQIRIDRQRFV